jgi:formyl-CoA transferase
MEENLFRDLTVLSVEQATVVPYLTYRLVQDGMEVIRLESPDKGDPNRYIGEKFLDEQGMNTYFLPINAGKKAITLNLAEPRGQELLKELIVKLEVDIFITNQLPKNYQKLGIDYESLSAVKSDLIWLGITGFGPQADEVAYDPVLQARGGLMELTGERNGSPVVTGIPLADMGTSEHGYGLLIKALYKRLKTGAGSEINLSMFESTVSWLTVPISLTDTFNKQITRRGNTHEFFAPVSVYPTSDGYVYIAVGNDRQWESVTGIPAFSTLAREEYRLNAGRIADVDNLNQAIARITRTFTADQLIAVCNEARVAISKVKSIEEVLKEPLVQQKLLSARDKQSGLKLTLAPPPCLTAYLQSVSRELSFPPRMGEDNREIYGEKLGLTPEELNLLQKRKII